MPLYRGIDVTADVREQLDDLDRADVLKAGLLDALPPFVGFASSAADLTELGADALTYVIHHDYVSVAIPPVALYYARTLAVQLISPRDTSEPLLRRMNRAIDLLAAAIRDHERAIATPAPIVAEPKPAPIVGGQLAPLVPAPIVRPPAPTKVEIPF